MDGDAGGDDHRQQGRLTVEGSATLATVCQRGGAKDKEVCMSIGVILAISLWGWLILRQLEVLETKCTPPPKPRPAWPPVSSTPVPVVPSPSIPQRPLLTKRDAWILLGELILTSCILVLIALAIRYVTPYGLR